MDPILLALLVGVASNLVTDGIKAVATWTFAKVRRK
jgi:hypothetical protein